jgi:hypothetical protein
VSFTLDRYGHLFPDADTELSGRLSKLYRGPKALVEPESDDGALAASSWRESSDEEIQLAEVTNVNRELAGGASWNRTSDLSIISAAL